jgi:hypothetical protein
MEVVLSRPERRRRRWQRRVHRFLKSCELIAWEYYQCIRGEHYVRLLILAGEPEGFAYLPGLLQKLNHSFSIPEKVKRLCAIVRERHLKDFI